MIVLHGSLSSSLAYAHVASSPGRFIFLSNYAEGRKNGLVFIAWVIVRMRYIIGIFHRKLYRKFINKIY